MDDTRRADRAGGGPKYVRAMIIWINGTFGVGKTTTANALLKGSSWRLFDPEHVGFLLAGNLRDLEFDDFQDLPPWRELVPAVADEIYRFTGPEGMVAVQTVLVADYWDELVRGSPIAGSQSFTSSSTATMRSSVAASLPTRSRAKPSSGASTTSPSTGPPGHSSSTSPISFSTPPTSNPNQRLDGSHTP